MFGARRFAQICVATTLLLTPLSGMAQEANRPTTEAIEEARRHYARGVDLYNEGSFAAALVELERANAIAPNVHVNYNLGLVHLQLGDFVSALRMFEQYLAGGSGLPPLRVAEVEERMKHLKARIALIDVIVNVPEARVVIDDVTVGRSPLKAPVAVNSGRHKIAAFKPGYSGETQFVSAAGQDNVRVEIRLDSVVSAVSGPPQEVAPPSPTVPLHTPPPEKPKGASVPWLGIAGTGILAAGAVTTGVLALSSADDLTSMRNQRAARSSELEAADSRARTLALVSDICAVGAVATLGVTLFVWLKARPREVKTSARVSVAPNGAGLSGTF